MEYITITEYAEQAHISKQAAYNRAKSAKYKGYFRKVKGVLMVDKTVFEVNQNFKFNSTVENGEIPAPAENPFNQNSTENSTVENELIITLQKQVETQAAQIEKLFSMIAQKDSIIKDISANMATITAAFQALQHENNLLEAGKIQAETPPPAENIPTEKESKAKNKQNIGVRLLGLIKQKRY